MTADLGGQQEGTKTSVPKSVCGFTLSKVINTKQEYCTALFAYESRFGCRNANMAMMLNRFTPMIDAASLLDLGVKKSQTGPTPPF